MKIIVAVGSRDVPSKRQIEALEQMLVGDYVLVTGDAPGLDFISYNAARSAHHEAISVHAFWERYGNSAGPERNSSLVFLVTLLSLCGLEVDCHAFPSEESKGTWDTVNKLKAAGFEVAIHR